MQNSYFTVSLYAEYITAMSKLKVPEKYHNDFFSAKNMGFIRQKGRWRGFQNWNAVFVQIIVGIIHIPKCSAIPHSLHGPQTRIRWEWMKPIMYFFFHTSGPFNILTLHLKFIFSDLFKEGSILRGSSLTTFNFIKYLLLL